MSTFIPATPYGILELLDRYGVETKGKHTVVIGRSHIVGRPMSILMGRKGFPGNSTVTDTHSYTKNIEEITIQADIIITALGFLIILKQIWLKMELLLSMLELLVCQTKQRRKGMITGDVDFENVSKSKFYYPVPGGVGPMIDVIKKYAVGKRKFEIRKVNKHRAYSFE
jgi:methylenetetrahydrofolate dehydrogenase (NADP+)/methenyltetrahydrofolate cyclohydrolase